jgi:hypothetical protein
MSIITAALGDLATLITSFAMTSCPRQQAALRRRYLDGESLGDSDIDRRILDLLGGPEALRRAAEKLRDSGDA